jgi:hypothetical protein
MKTQRNTRIFFSAMLAVITLSTAMPLSAQNDAKPRSVIMGFKVSPNFTWTRIMEGNVQNDGMSLGFSYGLMGDINIANNPNYWLSTELLVTSFPAKLKSADTLWGSPSGFMSAYNNVTFNYRLQYLQLPVSLKFKTNEIGNLTWWFQFGLAPSILIQNKVTTKTTPDLYKKGTNSHNPNSEGNDAFDFEGNNGEGAFQDNVVPVRLPLILGAGIEAKISGKTRFVAGLRFDNAFTDMLWDKNTVARNNYLGVQLGIFF